MVSCLLLLLIFFRSSRGKSEGIAPLLKEATQVARVAMGSKMEPNYACLFVGYLEEAILSQYTGFIPQLHKRYIDDVVGAACCDRKDLDDFINHVSNFHPALQYTHTISETSLPFLEINLHISGNHLQTSVCYKETDTQLFT